MCVYMYVCLYILRVYTVEGWPSRDTEALETLYIIIN